MTPLVDSAAQALTKRLCDCEHDERLRIVDGMYEVHIQTILPILCEGIARTSFLQLARDNNTVKEWWKTHNTSGIPLLEELWLYTNVQGFEEMCHKKERKYWVDDNFEDDLYEAWDKGAVGGRYDCFEDFEEAEGDEYEVETVETKDFAWGRERAMMKIATDYYRTLCLPWEGYVAKLDVPEGLRPGSMQKRNELLNHPPSTYEEREAVMRELLRCFNESADREWTIR